MFKRLLRYVIDHIPRYGLPWFAREEIERSEFDNAVDELNKTIDQLDRDIKIIRKSSEEGMKRHQAQLEQDAEAQRQLKREWESFKQKLPTENKTPE